jgi:hypothetical protein
MELSSLPQTTIRWLFPLVCMMRWGFYFNSTFGAAHLYSVMRTNSSPIFISSWMVFKCLVGHSCFMFEDFFGHWEPSALHYPLSVHPSLSSCYVFTSLGSFLDASKE